MNTNVSFHEFLTSQEKVVARNVCIRHLKVSGAVLNGSWIGRTEASIQHIVRSKNEIHLQLQARLDYLKCVHITLRQVAQDVVARADWAAYTSADKNLGYNFRKDRDSNVQLATSAEQDGYGVEELRFNLHSRRSILVDGSNIARYFPQLRSKALAHLLEGLKSKGYDPTVLFDANIHYVFEENGDPFGIELLRRLQQDDPDHTIIVPSGTICDDYLLLLANQCGYSIVSCDNFKQERYRNKYPWLNNSVESGRKRVHAPAFIDGMLLIPTLSIAWPLSERGDVYIKAFSNGMFLCANDIGVQDRRPILANRDWSSDWERFMILGNGDGTVSIKSKMNGKYLSAEIDSDGELNARADKINDWEKFRLARHPRNGYSTLRSCANNKFISIDPISGSVRACADVANEWEWLTLTPCA